MKSNKTIMLTCVLMWLFTSSFIWYSFNNSLLENKVGALSLLLFEVLALVMDVAAGLLLKRVGSMGRWGVVLALTWILVTTLHVLLFLMHLTLSFFFVLLGVFFDLGVTGRPLPGISKL